MTSMPSFDTKSPHTKWGYELIYDGSFCNDLINDYETIYKFCDELVRSIDMVPFGAPQIVYFGTGIKAGFTLVQLIETSNISCHFVTEERAMHLNVFSCKIFEAEKINQVVRKYFDPVKRDYWFIERNHYV